MDPGRVLWVAGGYLAGTLPSTYLAVRMARRARAAGASAVAAGTGRAAGETDPHVLMMKHLGARWTAPAAAGDVVKGFAWALAARHVGRLDPAWLAAAGTAVVLGHAFPFYLAEFSGRGLAAAAGVLLALLPVEMTIAGGLFLLGMAIRNSGLASTIGMGGVPAVASLRGQPGGLVAMGAAIFLVILARRAVGVRALIAAGEPAGWALFRRLLFDASGPSHRRA